jgi:hypothetical protein
MRKTIFSISSIALILLILVYSCKKDEEKLPPTISLKSGATYTQDGDTVQVGHKLSFGIHAEGISEVITNFTVKKYLDDGTVITIIDTALYSESLDLDKIFYQNVEDKAIWRFEVMDRNHMTAEVSLVLYKDPNSTYGGIYYYPSITLGFQKNEDFGHFLDPFTGLVYFEDSASVHQSDINILCYYDTNSTPTTPVLSSAGEMDNFSTDAQTHYPGIVNWTVRNYTKWDISVDNDPISDTAFYACQNDSLLIVSYHDVWGKKKFKYATAVKIIPFMTAAGKFGLIRVKSADEFNNGKMEIELKIQQ